MYPWQQNANDIIQGAIEQSRLPHGLLITAKPGSGEKAWLQAAAKGVLCFEPSGIQACGNCKSCQLFQAGTHPDFYWVAAAEDKKQIAIAQIRQLSQDLAETSGVSKWRVAVIYHAETMTVAGFNALLKTLEEPGNNTLLMLYSPERNRLPATIVSRCQHLDIGQASIALYSQWLQQQRPDSSDADRALALLLTHQAPLAAQQLLGSPEWETYLGLIDVFAKTTENQPLFWQLSDGLKSEPLAALNFWSVLCAELLRCQMTGCDTVPALQKLIARLAESVNVQLLFKFRDEILFQLKQLREGTTFNINMQFDALAKQWIQVFHQTQR
ncbi:MAG: DNA polymerase III subunit delta' [Gammaproteobacteria bacterium]|nr:DNA polymerase III subunit delta' [Gammaproteobacteria bacterium]